MVQKNSGIVVALFVVFVFTLVFAGGVWWWCVKQGFSGGYVQYSLPWNDQLIKVMCVK